MGGDRLMALVQVENSGPISAPPSTRSSPTDLTRPGFLCARALS